MTSCHLVSMDNTSTSEAGVPWSSHHCLLRWCVISKAVPSKKSLSNHLPPLTSSVLFGKGPEKQSSRPCTTASHYRSHLPTFVFAFSLPPLRLSSILSPFNCPCLLLSLPLFCSSCVLPLLSCSSHLALFLYLSIARSFFPTLFLVSLPSSSPSHGENAQSRSQVSAQSSLSDSFILSTNNPFNFTSLICVYPLSPNPHMHARTYTRTYTIL